MGGSPNGESPDVVYVVDAPSEELRYSLRSLVNVDHGNVWMVTSHLPDWCANVNHIPVGDDWYRTRNVVEKLYAAAVHPDVSESFQFWNDDFFALKPVEVPSRHLGVWNPQHPKSQHDRPGINDAVSWTQWFLHVWGVDPVFRFDRTHTPMVMDKTGLVEAVDRARGVGLFAPAVKTLFGNLAGVAGTEGVDTKVRTAHGEMVDSEWVSTVPSSWKGKAGETIRSLYPDPSPYEEG